jgi:hypothetical protein
MEVSIRIIQRQLRLPLLQQPMNIAATLNIHTEAFSAAMGYMVRPSKVFPTMSLAVGVSGRANGADGIGVFGYSSSLNGIGKGVSGTTHGANGSGVYGEAGSSTGISGETNYGGYFLVHGTSGRGVYGYADNDGNITNYGGYFEAKGAFARAVWGEALNTGSVVNFGGTFIAKGALGVGVSGSGGLWDFYADG